MKMWLILLSIPALIIYRSVYSLFLLPGTHGDLYFLNLYNLHEATYNLIIAILLLSHLKINKDKANLVIKVGIVFCFGISIYMMYGFLPDWIGVHIKIFTIPYYLVSLIVGVSVGIYLYFNRKTV